VHLKQGETEVTSGLAVYEMKNETLTITKNPIWNAEGRKGSAEKLVLNRLADTLVAEGKVFMELPLTNSPSARNATAAASTNRPVEIYSDHFTFKNAASNRLAEAVYRGSVRVVHQEATIECAELVAGFSEGRQVQSLFAKGGVAIDSSGRKAFGEAAEYHLADEKFALIGNPRWNLDDKTGRSDRVVFHPKTGEVHAIGNVEMLLPTQSAASMLPSFSRTNAALATNGAMRITAGTFSHQRDVSVFHDQVSVADARGTINCQLLTVVTGASNQLQRIVAQTNVVMKQKDMIAEGQRAEYDVRSGLVHLTGDPVLRGPDKSLRSEYFVIDRNANTFSVAPGKYRIELKLKKGQRLPQF
jgi:lipopolysaccharide export system protein LptA